MQNIVLPPSEVVIISQNFFSRLAVFSYLIRTIVFFNIVSRYGAMDYILELVYSSNQDLVLCILNDFHRVLIQKIFYKKDLYKRIKLTKRSMREVGV